MPPAPRGETADLGTLITGIDTAAGFASSVAGCVAGPAIPAMLGYARDPLGTIRGPGAMARSVYRLLRLRVGHRGQLSYTTLVSYCGTCDIAINIDAAAVPDPDVLLACLHESCTEITDLGGLGGNTRQGLFNRLFEAYVRTMSRASAKSFSSS
jgi:WS/DGAT C-terminal domain